MENVVLQSLVAREILDSRGNPTLEVEATLSDGSVGRAAVPSGASTGSYEALELRDGDAKRYGGKGVLKAKGHAENEIFNSVRSISPFDIRAVDKAMLDLDGTENKATLGANAMLGVSMAVVKAASVSRKMPLYRWLREAFGLSYSSWILPTPMMNIINGGKHAEGSTDVQEFMILPIGAATFAEAVRYGAEVFHVLKKILSSQNLSTEVGDEGGYSPALGGNQKALDIISQAIEKAGYVLGKDIFLGMDVAASSFYTDEGTYNLATENRIVTAAELMDTYVSWKSKYPIVSIEDPFFEDDWDMTTQVTSQLGNAMQIVGDDLYVTNLTRLNKGIELHAGNAILVKVNQIGTLSETVDAVLRSQEVGFNAVISHRSGETEDTFIADLAVALNAGQIKTGSLSRSERTAKYNQLMRIADELGSDAIYAGAEPFKKFGI